MNNYKQLPLECTPEYIEIPLSKTGKHAGKFVAIVSPEDADLAEFNWQALLNTSTYAYRRYSVGGKQYNIHLHRVIMERVLGYPIPTDIYVDHINHNGLDNRRENLRLATQQQNSANRRVNKNSISGIKGVYPDPSNRITNWKASITVDGKRIYLGSFRTKEEAGIAYYEAARKFFGRFANSGE